jgi:hypothetical protein
VGIADRIEGGRGESKEFLLIQFLKLLHAAKGDVLEYPLIDPYRKSFY